MCGSTAPPNICRDCAWTTGTVSFAISPSSPQAIAIPIAMRPHPLEIAELRMHIGHFLDGRSLKACALVCKAWHRDFQPLVWYGLAIPLEIPAEGEAELASWRASLDKNACWIKEVDSTYDTRVEILPSVEDILATRCRSLVSLRCTLNRDNSDQLLSLIERNRSLQCLSYVCNRSAPKRLPQVLQGHFQLRELQLGSVWLPRLYRILTTCPTLRKLALRRLYSTPLDEEDREEDGEQHFEPPKTLGLCSLSVRYCRDPHALSELLARLPFLEHIRLAQLLHGALVSSGLTTRLFQPGQFSRLTDLKLANCGQYQELLEAIPPRQLRTFLVGSRDTASLDLLLERQGPSLENLYFVWWVHYPTLAKFFFQSPRLKRIEVRGPRCEGFLDILDLLWQPWVCNDLEVLKTPIGFPPDYNGTLPPVLAEALIKEQERSLALDQEMPRRLSETQLAENLFVERLQTLQKLCVVCCGAHKPGGLSLEAQSRIRSTKTEVYSF